MSLRGVVVFLPNVARVRRDTQQGLCPTRRRREGRICAKRQADC